MLRAWDEESALGEEKKRLQIETLANRNHYREVRGVKWDVGALAGAPAMLRVAANGAGGWVGS